jgi:hypothetical protein
MWIKYNEELINLDKITTIRKSISESTKNIILLDSGKEVKKLAFTDMEDLEDYYNFLESSLIEKGIKERWKKGSWKK